MMSVISKKYGVLAVSTFAFTICFMIWMMFAVLGIPIKQMLHLNGAQFGLLASMPVLSGSLARLPLGILTDRFGGRPVFFVLMLICIPAVFMLRYAHTYPQFLELGFLIGLLGGSFSVGIAYVSHWFDPSQQGFAMGIFGAGNSGAALTKLIAPILILTWGWQSVPILYALILSFTAALFGLIAQAEPGQVIRSRSGSTLTFRLLLSPRVLRYCQYYSIVFGGYVALALWLTEYYVAQYGCNIQRAALLAACFSLPGGILRAVGGWISDRCGAHSVTWWVMWVSWLCLFVLSYPPTDLIIHGTTGALALHIELHVVLFTVLMLTVGVAFAFGKASVFKYIADDYPEDMGIVSGVVGLAGGLGGFALPILFGWLQDMTRIRSSCFMLLFAIVSVSLVALYFSEIRRAPLLGPLRFHSYPNEPVPMTEE